MSTTSSWSALLASCLLTACAAAAPNGPQALWTSDGRLVINQGGTTLATASPALFEAGWVGHDAGPDSSVQNTGATRALRITTGKGPVKVSAAAEATAGGAKLSYTFTPPGEVSVNSVHVAWNLPVGAWAGAAWECGDKRGVLPPTFAEAGLFSAKGNSLSLSIVGGLRLMVSSEQPVNFLLQDDRQWGGQNYTMRVIGLLGDGAAWRDPLALTFAVTGQPAMELAVDQPVTLKAGPDWVELPVTVDLEAGSALDFRPLGLLDGPAGKYGWLKAVGDHLEFERRAGRAVKLYGVNFCFSALYPDHALADRVADRLAMTGYNTVRIHHYESSLVRGDAPDSLTFNPDQLDRLEYFIAALAKRGIYVTTDLFVSRPIRDSETVEGGKAMDDYKLAVLVSDKARDNLKAFVRAFLGHQNPYTGKALAVDPMLCSLSLVNEGAAGNFLGRMSGEVKRLFTARFNAWLVGRYGTRAKLAAAWGDKLAANQDPGQGTVPLPGDLNGANGADCAVFLASVHMAFYEEMKQWLRTEMRCPAILTDINAWTENWPNQALRAKFDYVDNHSYWDHPQFLEGDWRLPSRGWSGGGSAAASGRPLHVDKSITQLLDRPFGFSEYNYANPNSYRTESGPLTGAYAALQGWDAVWRFAYSHDVNNLSAPKASNYFDMATDPNLLASDRFAALLFLRDTQMAKASVAVTTTAADAMSGTPAGLGRLGQLSLVTRLGSRVDSAATAKELALPLRGGAIDPNAGDAAEKVLAELRRRGMLAKDNATDLAAQVFVSDTGQLRLAARDGLFTVDTPGCQAIFSAQGKPAATSAMAIGPSKTTIGVYLASLSAEPVARAPRLLMAHVPDVQATGRRYAEGALLTLQAWGDLPLLVRDVQTQVTLKLAEPNRYRVYALSLSGQRLGEVQASVADGALVFNANSRRDDKGVLYYEVTR